MLNQTIKRIQTQDSQADSVTDPREDLEPTENGLGNEGDQDA